MTHANKEPDVDASSPLQAEPTRAWRMATRPRLRPFIGLLLAFSIGACGSEAVDEAAEPGDAPQGSRSFVEKQVIFADEAPPLPDWVREDAAAQRAESEDWSVFHDLRFQDRLPESGITFRNKVVPDGAKDFKANHYDHGNGLSAADVDGDGLLDLYFLSQVGRNELWRNLGDGRFEDITEPAGVAVEEAISVAAAFGDLDNDGDADLYVTTVRRGNRLFRNDGTGRFTDISADSGLDYNGHSSAVELFDFDRDGRLDVYVSNVGNYTANIEVPARLDTNSLEPDDRFVCYSGLDDAFDGHLFPERREISRLYRNEGDLSFADVTEAMGLGDDASWTGDATPLDANADGWTDLYVLDMQGNDEYYENQEGQRFVSKGREHFPFTPWGAMGVKAFDWDNDLDLDLYVTDMHSDMLQDLDRRHDGEKIQPTGDRHPDGNFDDQAVFGNAFYRNDGDGRFEEISDDNGTENYWPWGLSAGDLNADGYDDLFVTASMGFIFRYAPNRLLLNDAGSGFRAAEYALGAEPRRDERAFKPWFKLDCDDPGIFNSFCGDKTGIVQTYDAYASRSSVILDLENDGDLDIVTNDYNTEPMLLVSDLAQRHPERRVLTIELLGRGGNADGLGARVRVLAGDDAWLKVQDGQSGYLSQSDIPLYFGLGDRGLADAVEVTWPDGTIQRVDGPFEAGERLRIEEGRS